MAGLWITARKAEPGQVSPSAGTSDTETKVAPFPGERPVWLSRRLSHRSGENGCVPLPSSRTPPCVRSYFVNPIAALCAAPNAFFAVIVSW
jgi:hypothetical protein